MIELMLILTAIATYLITVVIWAAIIRALKQDDMDSEAEALAYLWPAILIIVILLLPITLGQVIGAAARKRSVRIKETVNSEV